MKKSNDSGHTVRNIQAHAQVHTVGSIILEVSIYVSRGVKRALSARYSTSTARKISARARFGHGISWARHGTARSEQARIRARGTKMVWHGTDTAR